LYDFLNSQDSKKIIVNSSTKNNILFILHLFYG
jgi:hypothetical protein